MQNYGSVLIVSKDIQAHRKFEVELFSRTDANWQIKQLLSGYYFEAHYLSCISKLTCIVGWKC